VASENVAPGQIGYCTPTFSGSGPGFNYTAWNDAEKWMSVSGADVWGNLIVSICNSCCSVLMVIGCCSTVHMCFIV
jgi:hypothetical protein